MNPEQFLTSATLRDRVKNFDYILDKVKQLKMIPTTNFASQEMVAQYYDVNTAVINMIVTRHRDELEKVGLIHKSKGDIINQVNKHRVRLLEEANLGQKGVHLTFKDGAELLIPNRGLRTFSKRAVFHIGLLLRDSEVAKQVRLEASKLLEQNAEEEMKRTDLAESDRIELEIKDIAAKWGVSMLQACEH